MFVFLFVIKMRKMTKLRQKLQNSNSDQLTSFARYAIENQSQIFSSIYLWIFYWVILPADALDKGEPKSSRESVISK